MLGHSEDRQRLELLSAEDFDIYIYPRSRVCVVICSLAPFILGFFQVADHRIRGPIRRSSEAGLHSAATTSDVRR